MKPILVSMKLRCGDSTKLHSRLEFFFFDHVFIIKIDLEAADGNGMTRGVDDPPNTPRQDHRRCDILQYPSGAISPMEGHVFERIKWKWHVLEVV